jgi:hypothetical protein
VRWYLVVKDDGHYGDRLAAHPLEPLLIDICGACAFFFDAAKLVP